MSYTFYKDDHDKTLCIESSDKSVFFGLSRNNIVGDPSFERSVSIAMHPINLIRLLSQGYVCDKGQAEAGTGFQFTEITVDEAMQIWNRFKEEGPEDENAES